ncbi:hypothetical protein JXM83_01215 [Candidatus Woesearchaeota archaeon]|nr:hypothetical protein [Candidatus Woesearchaeota archaeon]
MVEDEQKKNDFLNKKSIEISLRKFNDFASDVLNSDYDNFSNAFTILMNFFETDFVFSRLHKELSLIDVNFDKWWSERQATGGSFIGSKQWILPINEDERIAILFRICLKVQSGDIDPAQNIGRDFFAKRYDNLHDYIQHFTENVVSPLLRSIGYKVEEIAEKIEYDYPDDRLIPSNIIVFYQDNSVTVKDTEFNADSIIGEGNKIDKK